MVEQVFKMAPGNEKSVKKVIQDENLHYLHMVFDKNDGLPEHHSNSTVYMIILRGKLSIRLNDQEVHEYDKGDVLKIPFKTKMDVRNLHQDILELIVVKAPSPNNQ